MNVLWAMAGDAAPRRQPEQRRSPYRRERRPVDGTHSLPRARRSPRRSSSRCSASSQEAASRGRPRMRAPMSRQCPIGVVQLQLPRPQRRLRRGGPRPQLLLLAPPRRGRRSYAALITPTPLSAEALRGRGITTRSRSRPRRARWLTHRSAVSRRAERIAPYVRSDLPSEDASDPARSGSTEQVGLL